MTTPKLTIEILNGPCDGSEIILDAGAEWSKEGNGPLVFPWDEELGVPQAHVTLDEGGWWLEPVKSAHGTWRVNKGESPQDKVQLAKDDIYKASGTWLLIKNME